ncbi:hypothetical protein J6590_072742 [Homalodisca vitripennis]|nr:hypothetical protein J6590_072742 [Homalodisca vitripennis]
MAELSSDNEKSDDKTVKVSRKRGRSKNTETESKISPQKMMKQNKKIPLSSVKNDSQYERPEKSDDDSETDGTYYEKPAQKQIFEQHSAGGAPLRRGGVVSGRSIFLSAV